LHAKGGNDINVHFLVLPDLESEVSLGFLQPGPGEIFEIDLGYFPLLGKSRGIESFFRQVNRGNFAGEVCGNAGIGAIQDDAVPRIRKVKSGTAKQKDQGLDKGAQEGFKKPFFPPSRSPGD
jgi:hypothetical protein